MLLSTLLSNRSRPAPAGAMTLGPLLAAAKSVTSLEELIEHLLNSSRYHRSRWYTNLTHAILVTAHCDRLAGLFKELDVGCQDLAC